MPLWLIYSYLQNIALRPLFLHTSLLPPHPPHTSPPRAVHSTPKGFGHLSPSLVHSCWRQAFARLRSRTRGPLEAGESEVILITQSLGLGRQWHLSLSVTRPLLDTYCSGVPSSSCSKYKCTLPPVLYMFLDLGGLALCIFLCTFVFIFVLYFGEGFIFVH